MALCQVLLPGSKVLAIRRAGKLRVRVNFSWEDVGLMGFNIAIGNHRKTIGKCGLMGFYGKYPLVMTNTANWKMTIDKVEFPIKNAGSFHSYVRLPEGTI